MRVRSYSVLVLVLSLLALPALAQTQPGNTVRTLLAVGRLGSVVDTPLDFNAGFDLRVFDIESKAAQALVSAGAAGANSAADAARAAEAVITMLPNGEHVEAVLFEPAGAVETMELGSLFIDMSTIAPSTTDRVARRMAERGIAMLDAPVRRSSQHAIEGKLLIIVGGAETDLRWARPALEKLGDTIVHCGPVGSGARMKIVGGRTAAATIHLL